MKTDILIQCENLSKSLGGASVIEQVTLAIKAGEVVTLIGLNGSGKTTLLKALMGIIPPDSGAVTRRTGLRIGYVPQRMVFDSVMPLKVSDWLSLSVDERFDITAVRAASAEAGVEHLLGNAMHGLSGGELQRVMLARALLRKPDLLVLDEPVQAVDITGQAALYGLISNINRTRGCAVLMVSHDLHLVMSSTTNVICLNHHICCHGAPNKVSQDPAFIALFGKPVADSLAVYTHHHDHTHDMHGDVVGGCKHG